MGTNVERVERCLRGVAVPSYGSERHRQQLRRRILGEIGKKRTMPVPGRIWRIAAAAGILVCLGGALGTLIDMRYHLADRPADGIGLPVGKDAQEAYAPGSPLPDANGVMETVQTAREPEKADILPEPGDIEVVMVGANDHSPAQVIEVKARGRPATPLHYAVAQGRRNVVETSTRSSPPNSLSPADWVELSQLRQAGKGEGLGTQERQLNGHAFVFHRERYTLRNGAKVVVSVGMPKDTK
jgi:hypothetical protein